MMRNTRDRESVIARSKSLSEHAVLSGAGAESTLRDLSATWMRLLNAWQSYSSRVAWKWCREVGPQQLRETLFAPVCFAQRSIWHAG